MLNYRELMGVRVSDNAPPKAENNEKEILKATYEKLSVEGKAVWFYHLKNFDVKVFDDFIVDILQYNSLELRKIRIFFRESFKEEIRKSFLEKIYCNDLQEYIKLAPLEQNKCTHLFSNNKKMFYENLNAYRSNSFNYLLTLCPE